MARTDFDHWQEVRFPTIYGEVRASAIMRHADTDSPNLQLYAGAGALAWNFESTADVRKLAKLLTDLADAKDNAVVASALSSQPSYPSPSQP